MAEKWITTAQAADVTGYHPEHIRRLIRRKKVSARKFGLVWQVDKPSLLAYMDEMEDKGKKRGPKSE